MAACSNGDNFGLKPVLRYGQAVLSQGLDVEVNGFSYVFQSLLFGLALRDAAGQARTLHDPETILARVYQDLTAL